MRIWILSLLLAAYVSAANTVHTATVKETMNAGGYTYMKVAQGDKTYWVAITEASVHTGERVTFTEQMWMPNFKSRTLNRTFDTILFATLSGVPAHPLDAGAIKPANAPHAIMTKAAGGYSVAEVFANRLHLNGQAVKVHGKITKVSKGIMHRDWIHIEDGTGDAITNDLVFTAQNAGDISPGETVIAEGTVSVDKDFGYGYFYPVILEKSRFTKKTSTR